MRIYLVKGSAQTLCEKIYILFLQLLSKSSHILAEIYFSRYKNVSWLLRMEKVFETSTFKRLMSSLVLDFE